MDRLAITAAAATLATTPRMLRYREALGLLAPPRAGQRRRYGSRELATAALGAELEARYDVTPKALAFAITVLADERTQADVRRLGTLVHRLAPPQVEALDFDAAKGRRLLEVSRRSPS